MAQITVLDSSSAVQTVAKVTNTGATTATNALPVTLATDDVILAPIGAVGETAPASDTASSGLNGRMQRIAQRLTSIIAQLPASLGIKSAATSLSVTQATEDAARHPASLGSKADAASFPVTQSTEDKAVLAAMSAKLPASVGSKADASSLAVTQSTEDKVIFAATNTKLDTINTTLGTANTQLPTTVSGSVQITITRPANTTAYTAGDVIGASAAALTFATGMTSAQRVMIAGVDLEYDVAAIPSGFTTCRLHLYSVTPPSALADNAAWDLPSGDRASYLGYVDISQILDMGSTLFIQNDNVNKLIQMSGSASIFGYLMTTGAFTPAGNSEVLKVRLSLLGL